MGVKMTGRSVGLISTEIIHESGAIIGTTAPKDNGGDGSKFSPTDLAVAAYGTCVTTIMGLFARNRNIPVESITFELEKEMSTSPRRIGRIKAVFNIHSACDQKSFDQMVRAGQACPVKHSFHPDVIFDIEFKLISKT